MKPISLAEKEEIEIKYWGKPPTEKPGADSIENLVNKLGDFPILIQWLHLLLIS
jgi:hypothetical protein